jgi:hypothetical protein
MDLTSSLPIMVVCLFVLFVVSGLFHYALSLLGVWERMVLRFEMPKDPKYLTKADPIYKLVRVEYTQCMFVQKWELDYTTRDRVQILLLFIPYPIEIRFYEYKKVGEYYACESIDVVEFSKKYTLDECYNEKEMKADQKNLERRQREIAIDNLNKMFNENFEQ